MTTNGSVVETNGSGETTDASIERSVGLDEGSRSSPKQPGHPHKRSERDRDRYDRAHGKTETDRITIGTGR